MLSYCRAIPRLVSRSSDGSHHHDETAGVAVGMVHQELLPALSAIRCEVHGSTRALDDLGMDLPLPLVIAKMGQFGEEATQAHFPGSDVIFEQPDTVPVIGHSNEHLVVGPAVSDRAPGGVSIREIGVLDELDVGLSDRGVTVAGWAAIRTVPTSGSSENQKEGRRCPEDGGKATGSAGLRDALLSDWRPPDNRQGTSSLAFLSLALEYGHYDRFRNTRPQLEWGGVTDRIITAAGPPRLLPSAPWGRQAHRGRPLPGLPS